MTKQVPIQLQVQGEKNIIWDAIIEEANKFRPYLDYILDKELVIHSSKKALTVARETLNKKPVDCAKNDIDFMNSLSEDYLKKSNIKYRISIMTWDRKVINKYHHLDIVQEKVDILAR